MAVARLALVQDVPGGDLQGGEQGGGPVPDRVVDALLRPIQPHPADWLGALQGLDLGLVVHAQHHRPLRWVQIQADDVVDLGRQLRVGGELEGPSAPRLPYSRQTRATVSWLMPSSRASRRVDQWVVPSLGGGGLSVTWRISAR
jgi:hypothetical protein